MSGVGVERLKAEYRPQLYALPGPPRARLCQYFGRLKYFPADRVLSLGAGGTSPRSDTRDLIVFIFNIRPISISQTPPPAGGGRRAKSSGARNRINFILDEPLLTNYLVHSSTAGARLLPPTAFFRTSRESGPWPIFIPAMNHTSTMPHLDEPRRGLRLKPGAIRYQNGIRQRNRRHIMRDSAHVQPSGLEVVTASETAVANSAKPSTLA
ncbi:hypothetical protein EVAR_25286_1 [Eumeta japonica]|uniref:Uncharacterized protein n=1 Tax=Eumeta variegata TaxID=151549 RepID=A0A4C1VRI4_EUMVA|nr:hypothetical protein EVAR_25286_1 [Eumeta japonica]